jgi:hypothetical protein
MSLVYEGEAEKYSLGRSTGLTSHGWKKRTFALTKETVSYAEKAGAKPKLEIPVSAISVIFTAPTKQDHEMVVAGQPMFMVRLHENGVFNLLVKCPSEADKARFLAGLRSVLKDSAGFQEV